jgi:hypothetical protein
MLHIAGGTTENGSRWRRWWSRVVGSLAALFRKPTQAGSPVAPVANAAAADLCPHKRADLVRNGWYLSFLVDLQLMANCRQTCFWRKETGGLKNGR